MGDMRDQLMAQTEARVLAHGWTCIAVFPDPQSDQPAFAYSVGFERTFQCPEVVFVGFDPQLSQSLIAGIAASLRARELRLPPEGGRVSGVIQGFDVMVAPVPEEIARNVARGAISFAFPNRIRLVQIILPDEKGNFPGDPECRPDLATGQDIGVFAD